MLKDISSHSNGLEIFFWDFVFHLVKAIHLLQKIILQKIHRVKRKLSRILSTLQKPGQSLGEFKDFKRQLWILMILFETGMIIGLVIGYLQSL